MELTQALIDLIIKARQEASMMHLELGEKVGVTPGHIREIESGHRRVISVGLARKLEAALGICLINDNALLIQAIEAYIQSLDPTERENMTNDKVWDQIQRARALAIQLRELADRTDQYTMERMRFLLSS